MKVKWCPEPESNQRHADFQSGATPDKSKPCEVKARQTAFGTSKGYGHFVKPASTDPDPEKEKPGALAGATGLNKIDHGIKDKNYIKNRQTATALCHAILDCDPADACEILAVAYGDLRAGMPIAPLEGLMSEARIWAEFATIAELKAYAVACFTRLSAGDRAAFLAYVGGAA